jgi:hypothetical protein
MEAYRDQYATLFNNGQNVVVMAISVDSDTTLTNWSRQSSFPMLFVGDTATTISRISFKMAFRPLVQTDYDTLGVEIDKLAPPRKEGGP